MKLRSTRGGEVDFVFLFHLRSNKWQNVATDKDMTRDVSDDRDRSRSTVSGPAAAKNDGQRERNGRPNR